MPLGPGPGPTRGPVSPLGKTLQELYTSTGNRVFLDLMRKAGLG